MLRRVKWGFVLSWLVLGSVGFLERGWTAGLGDPTGDGEETLSGPSGIYKPRGPGKIQLTLKQCLEAALINNREIMGKQFETQVSEWKLEEATRAFWPVLDYEYNIAPAPKDASAAVSSLFSGDLTIFNRLRIGMGVPLTTFGKIGTARSLARIGIRASEQDRRKKQQEVVFQIKQIYYGILLGKEMDHLLGAARDRLREEIAKREERELEEEGEAVDPQEVLKLKVFLFLVEQKLDELYKKMELGYEALKLQTGFDSSLSIEVAENRLRPEVRSLPLLEELRKEALASRPDVQQLEAGLQAAERNFTLERRRRLPDLGVGAFFELGRAPGITGVNNRDDFTDPFNFTRAGLGLRLQGQFDWKGTEAKIRQAELGWKKVDYQKDQAIAAIGLDVADAYWSVKNGWAQVQRTREAQKLSRQLLFLAQSNIDIGLGDAGDLVEAIQAFMFARSKYFESVFDYNVAVAKLDQKLGRD